MRDGGYINDWNFGEKNIDGIIDKLVASNVDIIECGFIKNKNYDKNSTEFDNVSSINKFSKVSKNDKFFVAMAHVEEINENIEEKNNNLIQGIRVLFKKDKIDVAIEKSKLLKSKGYKVFLQPATIIDYSIDEFKTLIKNANEINPYAFYIVDTLGTMQKEQLLNLFNIADKNLNKGIQIGFHSHNNLQQAFSNAQALMELDTKRDIIIDSSVFGMGRGAGNLCTELLMQYLNEKQGENYNLKPIYKIFDEHLSDIFENTKWGYSIPLFISAKYKCHPNYVIFLNKVGIRRVQDIDEIISKVSEDKKSVFDKNYIEKLYEDFYKGNTRVLPLIIF